MVPEGNSRLRKEGQAFLSETSLWSTVLICLISDLSLRNRVIPRREGGSLTLDYYEVTRSFEGGTNDQNGDFSLAEVLIIWKGYWRRKLRVNIEIYDAGG
jgi:hypothetical protein